MLSVLNMLQLCVLVDLLHDYMLLLTSMFFQYLLMVLLETLTMFVEGPISLISKVVVKATGLKLFSCGTPTVDLKGLPV